MSTTSLIFAFTAGLVSFVAPCVLPLVPGFLAYLAGSSLNESGHHRRDIFVNSVFFVLGFSLAFAALGALLNSVLKGVSYDVQTWLGRLGGVIIIFFGLYLTGLFHISWLEAEHKMRPRFSFNSRHFTSLLFGAAFAVGWTPCVGPVLGAILTLAASRPGSAFGLLLSYAFGLGIPFLIVGLFAAPASAWIKKYAGALRYVNIIFGVLLIGLGILVFTQNLSLIANFSLLNSFLLSR